MTGEGPRYDIAAAVTAEIVNLHLDANRPKAETFGRILFLVLDAIYEAEHRLQERLDPSSN